jgi:hypothetical protein
VDVDMTVELNPGDAPLPGVRAAEAERPSTTKPEPQLTAAQLRTAQSALARRSEAFASCYTSGRTRDPGLWGRIGLRIAIDRGTIARVVQHESRFPDAAVVACVTSVVQATPFCDEVPGKLELEWAVRLGSPPDVAPQITALAVRSPPPPAAAVAPAAAALDQSVIAETAPARLPVGN